MTVTYLFTDEELEDIEAAAQERHVKPEELIRRAVLENLAA